MEEKTSACSVTVEITDAPSCHDIFEYSKQSTNHMSLLVINSNTISTSFPEPHRKDIKVFSINIDQMQVENRQILGDLHPGKVVIFKNGLKRTMAAADGIQREINRLHTSRCKRRFPGKEPESKRRKPL